MDLIRISEIKCFAAELGVRCISRRGDYVIEFNEENNADAFTLIVAKQKYGDQLVISSGNNPFLSLQKGREKTSCENLRFNDDDGGGQTPRTCTVRLEY